MAAIAEVLGQWPKSHRWALDPFAGIGGIHALPFHTVGIEIEREWADEHPNTIWGNALELLPLYPDNSWDAIITSPTWANRMADHHNPKDESKRISYKFNLGRDLTPGSAGGMQWGKPYRAFHEKAWAECTRILKPEGRFVLNISDHIRDGAVVPVSAWHLEVLKDLNLHVKDTINVDTRRMKQGANADLRVPFEHVVLLGF